MDFNIAKKPDENDRVQFGWKITVIRKSFASLKKWLGHNLYRCRTYKADLNALWHNDWRITKSWWNFSL